MISYSFLSWCFVLYSLVLYLCVSGSLLSVCTRPKTLCCSGMEGGGGGNYGEPEISQSHIQITQKLYFTQCNMHILYSSTRKQWGKSRGDGGLPRKIVQPTEISGKGEIGTVGDSLFLPRLIRLFLYNGLEEEATRKMRFFFSQSSKRNFVARFAVGDFFTIFFFFFFALYYIVEYSHEEKFTEGEGEGGRKFSHWNFLYLKLTSALYLVSGFYIN